MILTSPDGQWIAIRRGRTITLHAMATSTEAAIAPIEASPGLAGARSTPERSAQSIELESDHVELALVGPPTVLVAVYRGASPHVALYQPPSPELAARHDLDTAMTLAAITGPRIALVSTDHKQVLVVREAGRALSAQAIDTGSPVEFVVGLEKNQLLFGLLRKLRVWDAVSGRPLLQLQLQLPQPPRTVGAAQGHLWVTRPGSDEVFVYRLSDGRPFRHYVGAPVEDVVCHPASPIIVLVTARGLVRLHCFAHSLSLIDSPWHPATSLAQLVVGEEISLLGLGERDVEPWRVPISGAGTPLAPAAETPPPAEPVAPPTSAADKLRAMRMRANPDVPVEAAPPPAPAPPSFAPLAPRSFATAAIVPARARAAATWREPLAVVGSELVAGGTPALPDVGTDTELGELAQRLALPASARRAIVALYSLYLVGEPNVAIARLSQVVGDWTEPLGQGELGALAMLRRRNGRVALRAAVTDLLDGLAPRAIRIVGETARGALPDGGLVRVSRDGKSDAALETELASQLGRIAVLEGPAPSGVLEARLHDAPALVLVAPVTRPSPWPRAARMIVVADAAVPPWVAALPAL
ncbi:MAG TPA: hypothetical protein VFQ53_42370 [Kofleriaceae bacterium]|nr:hypothetical protein [Kofleriaceae bacterium]